MGTPKIKKRKFTKKDIKKLKKSAVEQEARNLIKECQDIFGDEYEQAMVKLIQLDKATADTRLQTVMILHRQDLYEILLDNSVEEIIEYFEEKVK